ncbi:hypothetical protein [Nocardia jejuensis]|uniref:hypothetical protein n=1 Tax=Nocardia jejuensis TaxID=328049 RepID=UPI00082C718D|nr:hypothetical protein [Nocardia jejuensis]
MISKFESNKDLIQEMTSAGARHVGNIANIITGTVAEVTKEIGDWITDAIEMREAAAAAAKDAAAQRAADGLDDDLDDSETVGVQADTAAEPVVRKASAQDEPVIDAEVVYPREF